MPWRRQQTTRHPLTCSSGLFLSKEFDDLEVQTLNKPFWGCLVLISNNYRVEYRVFVAFSFQNFKPYSLMDTTLMVGPTVGQQNTYWAGNGLPTGVLSRPHTTGTLCAQPFNASRKAHNSGLPTRALKWPLSWLYLFVCTPHMPCISSQ